MKTMIDKSKTVKVRRNWGSLKPVTKRIDSDRIYSRRTKWLDRRWEDLD